MRRIRWNFARRLKRNLSFYDFTQFLETNFSHTGHEQFCNQIALFLLSYHLQLSTFCGVYFRQVLSFPLFASTVFSSLGVNMWLSFPVLSQYKIIIIVLCTFWFCPLWQEAINSNKFNQEQLFPYWTVHSHWLQNTCRIQAFTSFFSDFVACCGNRQLWYT